MKEQNGKVDADHTTSLLQGDNKRVSISKQAQVSHIHRAIQAICIARIDSLRFSLANFSYQNSHQPHSSS